MSATVADCRRKDNTSAASWSVPTSFAGALNRVRHALLPLMAVADQAITSGVSFATAVIVGRSCSQEQLGVYYLLLTLVLALAGLHEAIISGPYAIFGARRQGRELAEFRGSVWAHHWVLTIVSVLAAAVALATIVYFEAEGTVLAATWAIVLAIPLVLVREAVRFFAFARRRVGTAITVDAIVAGVQIGGLFLLWWADELTVARVFLVMGAACLLGSACSLLVEPRSAELVPGRAVQDWKENWAFSKWIMWSFLIGNMIPLVMPWIVSWEAGTAATGVFGACATLMGVTNILVLGMGNFLKPEAATAYSHHGVGALRRLLSAAALLFFVVFGAFCLGIWMTGDWAMVLVFGPKFGGTGMIVGVLAANVLVGSLGLIVSFGLLALGLSRTNFLSDICLCVVTVVATLLLVYPYGALGAAIALLVGTLATTAMRTTSLYLAMQAHASPQTAHLAAVNAVELPAHAANHSRQNAMETAS